MTSQVKGPKPMIVNGKINSALYLNGLNYLIVDDFVNFIKDNEKVQELTIDFWFKVNEMSIG